MKVNKIEIGYKINKIGLITPFIAGNNDLLVLQDILRREKMELNNVFWSNSGKRNVTNYITKYKNS